MKLNSTSLILVKVLRYLLIAFVLTISLYPILWVLLNSFKQTPGGLGLPDTWVFDGYITIFTSLAVNQSHDLYSAGLRCDNRLEV